MIMNANPIIGPRRVREREEESLADSRDIRSYILKEMNTRTHTHTHTHTHTQRDTCTSAGRSSHSIEKKRALR